jgi:hypothetical protein
MKKIAGILTFVLSTASSFSEVVYDYQNQGAVFDGTNRANVALSDSGINFIMTIASTGGELNSNIGGLGVGDDQLDGSSEAITISFSMAINFVSIDFGAVGTTISDGVRLTVGTQSPRDLYTGIPGFNGTSKVYTPASVIRLGAGEPLVLTGSSGTSSFDLERITVMAVPEPATAGLLVLGSLMALIVRRASRA